MGGSGTFFSTTIKTKICLNDSSEPATPKEHVLLRLSNCIALRFNFFSRFTSNDANLLCIQAENCFIGKVLHDTTVPRTQADCKCFLKQWTVEPLTIIQCY